jgi:hypothetical protein
MWSIKCYGKYPTKVFINEDHWGRLELIQPSVLILETHYLFDCQKIIWCESTVKKFKCMFCKDLNLKINAEKLL